MAKKPAPKHPKLRFVGEFKSQGPKGAWTYMPIPVDCATAFGGKGRISVILTLNGSEFRTSIFPTGQGAHHVMINKAMQAASGAGPGDRVKCSLTADTAPRPVVMPKELRAALARNDGAKSAFGAFSWSHRNEYCSYVAGAKLAATRARRAEKAIGLILAKKRIG